MILPKEWICPVCVSKNTLLEEDTEKCWNDEESTLICYKCSNHFQMIGIEALVCPEPLQNVFNKKK